MSKRLSLCYAAPGHYLLSTSGTTRNILSLAKAISRWADVTVAFRRILEPVSPDEYNVIAIEPNTMASNNHGDDLATRGLNPFTHLAYLRTLQCFSECGSHSYDLVLEKGWRLSGFLVNAFRLRGVPGILVENDVYRWNEPVTNPRTVIKYLLHSAAQVVARSYSRRVPMIITETEELKAMLIKQRGIAPDQIKVVGLGVEHSLFRPLDQRLSRQSLGIPLDATVLLYVGGMDKYHDLRPVIEALAQIRSPSLELHMVGDGEHRKRYEEKARGTQITVKFHGRVFHHKVPDYIAAADVCIAPYCASAFHNGQVTFSTLKIPEYMAGGRPVISIPSGHIQSLIKDQISGFLFPNDVPSWVSFLKAIPPRKRLEEMGRAAAQAVERRSWENTAARYLEVCQALVDCNFPIDSNFARSHFDELSANGERKRGSW
jgi:glycosyltransferase involved in cell wall biosynthesis